MIIEANMRRHRWTRPNGSRCSFEPDKNEPQIVVGRQRLDSRTRALRNPVEWDDAHKDEMLAARLFVGLSVGRVATYSVDDVVDIVLAVMREQAKRGQKRGEDRHVDASFVRRGSELGEVRSCSEMKTAQQAIHDHVRLVILGGLQCAVPGFAVSLAEGLHPELLELVGLEIETAICAKIEGGRDAGMESGIE
jgi:hypothetical protein